MPKNPPARHYQNNKEKLLETTSLVKGTKTFLRKKKNT